MLFVSKILPVSNKISIKTYEFSVVKIGCSQLLTSYVISLFLSVLNLKYMLITYY
ncbi:hypothetical protein AEQU3_00381 [Aequorivita antarctica]|nr:hypothetical protein AEQU3_00381 [Aequorivita antarctica]